MAEHATFKLRHRKLPSTGPHELWGVMDYEGPFGPMQLVKRADGCLALTGPAVGEASLCVPSPEDPPAATREDDSGPGVAASVSRLGPIIQGHLRLGIDLQVGDQRVRLHQPKRGLLRSARTLKVDRRDRTAVFRNRSVATLSMETADGATLVRRGRATVGRVWPTADALDVAVFLLVDGSGLGVAVDL